MASYIFQRILISIPVILGILFVTFLIKAAIPTDAVTAMFQGQLTEAEAAQAIANIRSQYNLDQPWYMQFVLYVGDVLQGDLGESVRTRQPVWDEIGYRYVNTLILTA